MRPAAEVTDLGYINLTCKLDETFQQILQFPHFGLSWIVDRRLVVNVHAQRSVVVAAAQCIDDASVFDLPLANPNLELVGVGSAVAQSDMPHIGIEFVKLLTVKGARDEVTR